MKKFIKYARRKTSSGSINFDRGSSTSLASRASVSLPSEPSSEFGSVRSLGAASSTLSVYHVDLKTKDKTFTKLHRAAWLGDLEKVKKLVKKDDVNGHDVLRRTPLHLACAHGNKEVVWFLLGCKGNLALHDYEGYTPFLRAVQAQHTALVQFLLDRAVDPNDVTENEDTALHISSKLNASDITVILLQKGANVDAVNKYGSSPLHIATENCHTDMAELLLRHGANVNVVDNDDRSCLMLACRLGSPQLVALFLDYGSNRNLRDKSGLTAAEYAIISQQNECLKLMGEEIGDEVSEQIPNEDENVDWKINEVKDNFETSSSRLNSWNDESEKELEKDLLPQLNLNKFLASLDDSDKDVSEIDAGHVTKDTSSSAPPKPPRISTSVSEQTPEVKLLEFDFNHKEDDYLEDVFEDDERPVESVVKTATENKTNDDVKVDDNDEIDLDLSILSDVIAQNSISSEILDKEEETDETKNFTEFNELEVKQLATEDAKEDVQIPEPPVMKKKRPTPPPRYTKRKEINSSPTKNDWDTNNNSLSPEEKKEEVQQIETARSQESDWDTSITCNKDLDKQEGLNVEKHDADVVMVVMGENQAETPGSEESDWDTSISSNKDDGKQLELSEEMEKTAVRVESPKKRLFAKKNDVERLKPSPSKPPLVDDGTFIAVYKNLTDSESDWSEELSAKSVNRVTEKVNKTENGEEDGKRKGTPLGTLGREDTLHGIDEIWEKNPSVEVRPWDLRNESSEKTSLMRPDAVIEKDSGISSSPAGKGNVAFKKNLFESQEILRSDFDTSRSSSALERGMRNVSVDVNALENILQGQLVEQQRRLDSRSERSFKFELQQRRHSVDLAFPTINAKSYKALLAQKYEERPSSTDSNLSEPIDNRKTRDDENIYKATLAIAEMSSEEELKEKKVKLDDEKAKKQRNKLSFGKFPTLKKLAKRLNLSTDKDDVDEKLQVKVVAEDEKEDFVEEVLERLDIRRKSSAGLLELGERRTNELIKTPSLDDVSEASLPPMPPSSPSSSSSSLEKHSIDAFENMAENPLDKSEQLSMDDSIVSIIKLKDPRAVVKLQDFVRDLRLQLEREKGEHHVLSQRVQSVVCEKEQLENQLEGVRKDYCSLREKNAVLESNVKANQWELQQSENKWKECDGKLKKMLTYINSKEESWLDESSRRQQSEMGNQALLTELCVVKETLSVLHNECKQLQKEFLSQQNTPVQSGPSSPSWAAKEIHNKELGVLRNQLDDANRLCKQLMNENQELQRLLNSQKVETVEWKNRVEQLQCTLNSERGKMQREVSKAREGQVVEEEALKEATLGYMVQVNNLQSENNGLRNRLEESVRRISALESEISRHMEEASSYRGELCMLRRTFDESQKNYISTREEAAQLRKRLEVDLELVCKENAELKENLRTHKGKNSEQSSPRFNEMERLRNQVSLLHDEMSYVKSQLLSPGSTVSFDNHGNHHPIAQTFSGPFLSDRPPTPPKRLCQTIPWSSAEPQKKDSKQKKHEKMFNNSDLSSNGCFEDEQQVTQILEKKTSNLTKENQVLANSLKNATDQVEKLEAKLSETVERLEETEENLKISENKVHSLEVALVAAQDIIDKVNEEKIQLMEFRTTDVKLQDELERMQQIVTHLESETKELRLQSEESKMHSHKLQDELLRVRMDYKRSEERLMDETNRKRDMLKEVEIYQEERRQLAEEVEVLKDEKEQLVRRLEDEVEEQKRLWQVEARGRAELAIRLLDAEQTTNCRLRPDGDANNVKNIRNKDEELERERNRCAKMEDELERMKHVMKSVDLSHVPREISSQIEELEHQVLELKCYISQEQEMHRRDRNRLKKAKETLHHVPDLRKRIAELERMRDELREELVHFRRHVKENYVEREELQKVKADCEARANHDVLVKIQQMRAHFDRKAGLKDKLNNELQMRSDLQTERTDELNRTKSALRDAESQLEMLRDQCSHLQEMYMLEVNLRAKLSSKVNEDKLFGVGDAPFIIRNNQIKHLKESNKRLKSRTDSSKSKQEFVETSQAQDMIYKVRAALDKSIEKHLLNQKY